MVVDGTASLLDDDVTIAATADAVGNTLEHFFLLEVMGTAATVEDVIEVDKKTPPVAEGE